MNLIEKVPESLRRLHEVVGEEVDFDRGDAQARIAGVQSRKHEMEKAIGVFQMAAPGIQILVDQAERLVGTLDGKFEKALGLLLRRQMADGFDVGVNGAVTRGPHEGRRPGEGGRERRRKVETTAPAHLNASGFRTQK